MTIVQSYLRRAPLMCSLMQRIVTRARAENCESLGELKEIMGAMEFEIQIIGTFHFNLLSAMELQFLITRLNEEYNSNTIISLLTEDTEEQEDLHYDELAIYERFFSEFFSTDCEDMNLLFDHYFENLPAMFQVMNAEGNVSLMELDEPQPQHIPQQ